MAVPSSSEVHARKALLELQHHRLELSALFFACRWVLHELWGTRRTLLNPSAWENWQSPTSLPGDLGCRSVVETSVLLHSSQVIPRSGDAERECAIFLFFHSIWTAIVFLPRKDIVMRQVLEKICSRAHVLEIAWRSPLFSPSSICLKRGSISLRLDGIHLSLHGNAVTRDFHRLQLFTATWRCKVCLPGGKRVFKKPFTSWKTSSSNTGYVKSIKYQIEPEWKTNLERNVLIDLREGDWNEMALYPFYP